MLLCLSELGEGSNSTSADLNVYLVQIYSEPKFYKNKHSIFEKLFGSKLEVEYKSSSWRWILCRGNKNVLFLQISSIQAISK